MRISQRSIEEVRETADIVEVTSEFTALKRQGARFSGFCPYPDHQEKTPSFSVSPDRGFYYCFGCQRGGDTIKLVMDLKSLDFAEAISYLAERAGVDLQFEGGGDPDAARQRTMRRRQIHKVLAAATIYYHKYLLNSQTPEAQQARRYLEDRKIEGSTIEEFRLGYAPPRGATGFLAAARRLNLDRDTLDVAGLLSARGGERFAGRIAFPISDRRGRIVGFGARTLGDAQPKYLNSPETDVFNKRDLLYGFPQVSEAMRRERAALVVEGYTDVLMLYQSGIKNAVATLGTATTPGHLRTLSGYADKIYVLFDPDAAGEKAIERAAATAADLKLDLRVLRLPEDPADWLLRHPPEEFADLLTGAMPVLEYGIRREAKYAQGASAAERAKRLSRVKELISQIEDPVFHRDAIRIASESFGVGPEVFQTRKEPTSTDAPMSRVPPRLGTDDALGEAGRRVLGLMLTRFDLATEALRHGVPVQEIATTVVLRAEDFGDRTQAFIFSILADHKDDEIDAVLADERLRPVLDEVAALASQGDKLFSSSDSFRVAWLRLAVLSREQSLRNAKNPAGGVEADADSVAWMQAYSELQALKKATNVGPSQA